LDCDGERHEPIDKHIETPYSLTNDKSLQRLAVVPNGIQIDCTDVSTPGPRY